MALTHASVWAALDALAKRVGLSTSGLAKAAKLDPTSFNRSKRVGPDGRPRWPSTESVAKVLEATGVSFAEFAELATGPGPRRGAPLLGFAQAGADGYFDDAGFPVGEGWDEIHLPHLDQEGVYALEISGDSMAPVYREGDRIIVGADIQPRRGDRVVVKTTGGEVMAKELARLTAKTVELRSLNPAYPDRKLDRKEIAWMGRILWASQ
jgi:phage repressor protein C with HTH and peptisase S24 domain